MSERDRRTLIADIAIEIVAEDGVRALTHRAVDRRLGLPAGSTSFYARTKRALLELAASRLAVRARTDFDRSEADEPAPRDIRAAAERIAVLLNRMLGPRRSETAARYALFAEVAAAGELRMTLARAAFSRPLAVELLTTLGAPDPDAAGADLVSLCEGLVFDRVAGNRSLDGPEPGIAESIAELARPIQAYLRGVLAG